MGHALNLWILQQRDLMMEINGTFPGLRLSKRENIGQTVLKVLKIVSLKKMLIEFNKQILQLDTQGIRFSSGS